jgi:effector-binding domain-containing protein
MQLLHMTPIPFAALPARARIHELPKLIPNLLTPVWNFIRQNQIPNTGKNIVLYRAIPNTPNTFNLEAGVCTTAPFTPTAPILAAATPAGTVITTTHTGPYHLLPRTHSQIHQYAHQNHHPLAGISWELYGHWTADESQLQTEISYLLA